MLVTLLYRLNIQLDFFLQNGMEIDENYDFEKCIGLQVKPRQGDALLFYSLFPNNTIDPVSISELCKFNLNITPHKSAWMPTTEE